MNGIVNEIEIQDREKPAAAKFFAAFITVYTQLMNETVNEIEIPERKSPPQAKFFYRICHSWQTNNEWNRERIELHEREKPAAAAGEILVAEFVTVYKQIINGI